MAELIQRDRMDSFVGGIGVNKATDIVSKIVKKHVATFLAWLNKQRKELYFEGAGDTSKVAKYRKKTNTQRTKERLSYKRGSEFGGTKIENIVYERPMMMSGISFTDIINNYYSDTEGLVIMGDTQEDASNRIDNLTRKILEKNGNRGRLPSGMEAKIQKMQQKIIIDLDRVMTSSGY